MTLNKINCKATYIKDVSGGGTCDSNLTFVESKEIGYLTPFGNYSDEPGHVDRANFKRIRM